MPDCNRGATPAKIAESSESPITANTPTKADLLSRAKVAIEAGDQSMRAAAEALSIAQELHGASQAEMARAVGKSEAWISRLLQWRREDYEAESPFGPTTKAARLKHAKDRATSGASKPRKPRKPKATVAADDSTAAAGDTGVKTSPSKDAKASAHALAEFKYAVDAYVPKMDDAAKQEATAFFLKKAGVEALRARDYQGSAVA
jgi:hypothetical protein